MKSADTTRYYRDAPDHLKEELFAFRHDHPFRSIPHGGLEWRYQVGGKGKRTIFFLPGGMQMGEAWFRYCDHFQDCYRWIALTYPDAVQHMAPLVAAIHGILEKEAVSKVLLIGSSLGGLVVQAYLHAHPQRVTHAVIADTAAPNERWALRMRYAIRMLRAIPLFLLTRSALKRLDEYVSAAEEPARSFWRAFMTEHYKCFTRKAWLINHRAVIADFCETSHYTPGDLSKWKGKALIVESESDLFGREIQKDLRRLYPMSRVYRFKGDIGHSPAITRERQYMRMLENFLEG
jgi:pimeloyl-ACP methyl ester carboxylesterase